MAKQANSSDTTASNKSAVVIPFRGRTDHKEIEWAAELFEDRGYATRPRFEQKALARDLDHLFTRVGLLARASGAYVPNRRQGVDVYWEQILHDIDGLAMVVRGKKGVAKRIRRRDEEDRKPIAT